MLGSVSNNINVITSGPNVVPGGPGGGASSIVPNNNSGIAPLNNASNGGNLERNLDLLFNLSAIETRDDFEEKMCRTYMLVQNILANKSESQAHEELNKMAGQSATQSEEITIGLIVSILLEPNNAPRFFRDMIHISRDGMGMFSFNVQQIISEKYFRMHDHSRKQLLWLIKEMLRSQVTAVEAVFYNMFRNIIGGDLTPSNIALADALLDIVVELRSCYETNISLLSFSLFNFLRLIVDHQNPSFRDLRAKEITFCCALLRERFGDFIWIGRDLVRLLQQVATIPEFEQFWTDLINNPTSLAPAFSGVVQLMKIRTPRRFFKLRLTMDMEKKLIFLTSQVRFGQHRRYQDWLQKQYFSTHESQMLRCDMIRFICCYIHPSNETLASDIFPRWALIGWILSVCSSHVLSSYAKMALFYDWLFFDDRDQLNNSIMDIEPGILVMYYSLKNYPSITSGLIDFLCRISNEFHPSLSAHVKQGVRASLQKIYELRVLASLGCVFDSPKLDAETRQLFRDNFPEFTPDPNAVPPVMMNPTQPLSAMPPGVNPGPQQPMVPGGGPPPPSNLMGAGGKFLNLGPTMAPGPPPTPQPAVIQMNHSISDSITAANFSDDEDDSKDYFTPSGPATKKLKKSNSFSNGSGVIRHVEPNNVSSMTITTAPLPTTTANTTAASLGASSNSVEYITSIIHNSVQSNSANGNGNAFNAPLANNVNSNAVFSDLMANNVANNHLNAFSNYANNTDIQLPNSAVSGAAALSKDELMQQIEHFPNIDMRTCLVKLCQEKSKSVRCQEMTKLAKLVLDDDSDEIEEYSTNLTIILLALLEDDLSIRIFPLDYTKQTQLPDDKELKESVTGPLFVMFRLLAESYEDDQAAHSSLLTLLAAMGTNNSKVGYLLIYFLIVGNFMSGRMCIYRNYAREMSKELAETLLTDLRCCAYDDVYMFFFLLPDIFINLSSSLASTNTDLVKLIVSHADSTQLQAILGRIISGSIKLLRKEGIMPTLTASLEWDSLEQYFVWQIFSAHNISVDQVIPILAKLEFNVHSEALTNLMLFIQRESPTANLIKHLFNRESKSGDNFTVSILIHWAQSHAEKLAELIGNFISTKISSPNKRNKRTLNNTNKSQVSIPSNIEQILFYLDDMRKMSKNNNFFTQEYMIIVLDQLKQFCSATQKTKYQELFTNVPDDNDNAKGSNSASTSTTNSKKSTFSGTNKKNSVLSKTRSGNTVNNKNNDSETESESSDDDVPLTKSKANARKKRKQALGSDSD